MSIEIKHGSRISPEFVLLGFLYKVPGYGYKLHKQLQEDFGAIWHISQSQTYNIIKRLQGKGDILILSVEPDKLPARQLLQLTEAGSTRFNRWLFAPTNCSVHAIRVEFITRLYFIQQYQPSKIHEIINAQALEVSRGLDQLKEQKILENKMYNRLALDLRIQLLQSIQNWLEECQVVLVK